MFSESQWLFELRLQSLAICDSKSLRFGSLSSRPLQVLVNFLASHSEICPPHIAITKFEKSHWAKKTQRFGITLVAFHPRPQIASDLGRHVTRSFNPHRNRNQFPSGNELLAYQDSPGRSRINPLRFENRKPNPPLFTGDLNSSNGWLSKAPDPFCSRKLPLISLNFP